MTKKQPVIVNLTQEKDSELIFERSPVISSHQIAWSGLSLEYHQQAPGETPQYLLVNPTISINVGKSSFKVAST